MPHKLELPAALHTRIRRDLRRRRQYAIAGTVLVLLTIAALECLVGLGLDRYLLLPGDLRRRAGWLLVAPVLFGVMALAVWLLRNRTTAGDLRRLDNTGDDMRAAMNLVDRSGRGDSQLSPELVRETVRRAGEFVAQPLPPLVGHSRRLKRAALVCGAIVLCLLGYRFFAADLHTGISRYLQPDQDYGTVGSQKFHVHAELFQNPMTGGSSAAGSSAAGSQGLRKLADNYFLRERWENGAWTANFDSIPTTLADVLAGYNPLAVHRRNLAALEGDRLALGFNAVDRRGRSSLENVEFLRFDGERPIASRYLKIDDLGTLTVDRLQQSFDFQLRAGDQLSPLYRVDVARRPTPTQIYLFQRQPSQYGQSTRELTIRDRAAGINQNRLSGLPGSKLTVEFATPYGADLDPQASHALLGGKKLIKLRYATSLNAERRAKGEKLWTFDFTLGDDLKANSRLQLNLATRQAQFQGAPIANVYDDPLLVQVLEDLPPSVEFTLLPEPRHFASDDLFPLRYHYSDDYGITELGVEIQTDPNKPDTTYVPIGVRESDQRGKPRREDELLYILDLHSLPHNYASFSIVAKDVRGQVAHTGLVTLTTSDNYTETLLPKLTGGWAFAWSHAPNNFQPRASDLETPPAAVALPAYRQALLQIRGLLDGKTLAGTARDPAVPFDGKPLADLAKPLSYYHAPYLVNGIQPFAFHHRDYPYYFQRQASAYLTALPLIGGAPLAEPLKQVAALAASPDVFTAAEFEPLKKYAELFDRQLALADLVDREHSEIALRAALLRVSALSKTLRRRLAAAEALFQQLRQETAPPADDRSLADPWKSLPRRILLEQSDYNLRERGRMLTLMIRNLDFKLAALNGELDKILKQHAPGLDSRLTAMLGMVSQFGKSVYGIDRAELAAKAEQLALFIDEGILASSDDVYQQIALEFPSCLAKTRHARAELQPLGQFAPQSHDFFFALQAVVATDLSGQILDSPYKTAVDERTLDNRRSRMRGRLDQLTGQFSGMLRGIEFKTFQDLSLVRLRIQEAHDTLVPIQADLKNWPALEPHAELLATALRQIDVFAQLIASLAGLQSDLRTLAGFQSVFAETGLPNIADRGLVTQVHTVLGEIAGQTNVAPDLRAAQSKHDELTLQVQTLEQKADADAAALGALRGQIDELNKSTTARVADLDAALGRLEVALVAVVALPAPPAATTPKLATAPHPKISAASSQLFETLRCEQVLARLDEDLRRYADRPEMQDSVFETAVAYFVNLPADAAKDALANPIEEYLAARSAMALGVSSAKIMRPFAETYARDGNEHKPELKQYFQGRDFPPQVEQRIDQTNYATPELPADVVDIARPYLEAFQQNRLTEMLRAQRTERLAQLLNLARQLNDHGRRYEALVRVRGLRTLLVELQDNVRLLRYTPDDIRTDNLWSEAREQAEGLDRDLLAGRLPAIGPEAKTALQQRLPVLRQASYAALAAGKQSAQMLAEYEAQLAQIEQQLLPVVQATEQALRTDSAVLQTDLALVMLSSFQTQYWFQRKLELELFQKQILLGSLTGKARITNKLPMGPVTPSIELMQISDLAAFGWRSICNLRAIGFAADPSDEQRNRLLHDCGILTALKVLPEFYFDNFTGAMATRNFVSVKACDSSVETMLAQINDARQVQLGVIRYLLEPTASDLVTRDTAMVELLGKLQVSGLLFHLEREIVAYQQLYQAIVGNDPVALKQAARTARTDPAALGHYWRRIGRQLAAYLDEGRALLDAEVFAALTPDAQKQVLERQLALTKQARDDVERLGAGLDDQQRAEFAALGEALAYGEDWLKAIGENSASAADTFQPGYRDIHESVASLLQSLQGSMFPAEPSYPQRLRYKYALYHLEDSGLEAVIQATERRWFNRADHDQALVYEALLDLAGSRLAGAAVDASVPVWNFSRFVDTKYRYLMTFNAPKADYGKPVPRTILADDSMPEHLSRGLNHALSIDLPDQDNRRVQQRYFEALQEARSAGATQP